jgi:DedD protein
MALFSARSNKRDAQEASNDDVPLDSFATLRKRAYQRLVGAVVLVALGIVGFTLLFDSQPRPIPVDIQITMPDKDKAEALTAPVATAAPVSVPSQGAASGSLPSTSSATSNPANPPATSNSAATVSTATVAAAVVTTAALATAAVKASASLSEKEEIVQPKNQKKTEPSPPIPPPTPLPAATSSAAKAEAKPDMKSDTKSESKPAVKPVAAPVAKLSESEEAAKAIAILEGKAPPKPTAASPTSTPAVATTNAKDVVASATATRYIVQVGAFAENDKARAARQKVEAAGLKTYVHVAETPQGRRIRVRVGPFTTQAEADNAAAKIKTLDLPAAILTL